MRIKAARKATTLAPQAAQSGTLEFLARFRYWFPIGGTYREELHGGNLDLSNVVAQNETWLQIPSNYGRVWSTPWRSGNLQRLR